MVPPSIASFVSAWMTDLDFRWGRLIEGGRPVRLAKDEVLFHERQPARTVYVIQEGRVRLSSFAVDGRERHLMILGSSGLIGDCGLPSTDRYAVTATAAAESIVLAVPAEAALRQLAADAALARQHQTLCSRRFRIMLQQLELQSHNSATRRVSHHLVGLVQSYGVPCDGGTRIGITFTQQEMGNICGLSRVSVSNIFSRLEREGWISRLGRHMVVRDVNALRGYASGTVRSS